MKILFIGGSGVISSACTRLLVQQGHELYLLNRGKSLRQLPESAHQLRADVRQRTEVEAAIKGRSYDVVVDWIAFRPDHVRQDLELLRGRVGQYVFISSASVYQTPPAGLPVSESTVLHNPVWKYSRDKTACESLLTGAYRLEGFPVTIVRPSHTYDPSMLPVHGGYTVISRMRLGKPVVVHGDGTSLWTLTHNEDFARGFVGLLGNPHAIGEAVHITSDELLTWNQIYTILGRAAGVQPQLVHVPSDLIAAYDPHWGDSLLGDKAHSMIFDNSKIKRLVPGFQARIPFAQGAREMIEWYNADPSRQVVNPDFDAILEQILSAYARAWPAA